MNVKQVVKEIYRDGVARWLLLSSIVVNAGCWASIVALVPRSQTLNPLHYTIYFGINLTGPWSGLFWLTGLGVAVIVVHILYSALVNHRTWWRLWMLLALFINLLAAVDLVAVIYLIRTYTL